VLHPGKTKLTDKIHGQAELLVGAVLIAKLAANDSIRDIGTAITVGIYPTPGLVVTLFAFIVQVTQGGIYTKVITETVLHGQLQNRGLQVLEITGFVGIEVTVEDKVAVIVGQDATQAGPTKVLLDQVSAEGKLGVFGDPVE